MQEKHREAVAKACGGQTTAGRKLTNQLSGGRLEGPDAKTKE